MIPRPTCGFCNVPLGSANCAHIWIHDDEVTMSTREWRDLLATSDRFRRAIQALDSVGYEAGEYDTPVSVYPPTPPR